MKRNYKIDGVDMVTFPGADGIFSSDRSGEIELIKRSVSISVEKHGSRVLAVAGHYDCAGNPGDLEHHYSHVRSAMSVVSSWNFPVQVVGLYVNDKRQIEEVK